MVTILYHPKYWRNKRIFLTKKFKYSKVKTLFEFFSWKFKIPLPNNLVTSGPEKLVNNLLKSARLEKDIIFNRYNSNNFYILQYDTFGKKALKKIFSKNSDSKVLVGPLYNYSELLSLSNLLKEKDNIKVVVASKIVKDILISHSSLQIHESKIEVLPVGISSRNKKTRNQLRNDNQCLVYFKKRDVSELRHIENVLNDKKIKYKIFEYGNYKNSELINYAKCSTFGITLTRTESQGIAIQELLNQNLPLIVNEYKKNTTFIEGQITIGSSVPFWSEKCGLKLDNLEDINSKIDELLENLHIFEPGDFINTHLSFETTNSRLLNAFENYDQ